MQARERLTAEGKGGERIVVCDSRTGAERGASAAEAKERADAVRDELKIWFAVDTLDFLRRGGRIGAARAWIGTTLKIKPILTLEEEITPVERVRTRARAFERMVGYARQRHEDGADAWVVQHVQDPENAERMIEACRPIFGCDPTFTSEVGPVIGAHVGPGLLGVGGVSKRVLAQG
jgi:DegV family protein with EDD domain